MQTVRYFAAARAAAGVDTESVEAPTLAVVMAVLARRHGPQLAAILAVASFLVDGLTYADREALLPAGATIDVLPPFAGG